MRDGREHVGKRKLMLGRAFLESLLRTASEGIVVHDASGKIIFCNDAAIAMIGLPRPTVLGQTADTLQGGTIREDGSPFPASEHPAMVTLRTGAPCENVVMGIRHAPKQPLRWISINSARIPNDTSEPQSVFAVFSDISQHVEAKRRLSALTEELRTISAYHRAVLFNSPVGISVFDPNRICILANDAFAKVFGAEPDQLVGASSRLLYRSDKHFREVGEKKWPVVTKGKTFRAETPMRRLDGTSIWVRQTAALVDITSPQLGIILTVEDITRQLRHESELRRTSVTLVETNRALKEQANSDALTGLPNRRRLMEIMENRLRTLKESGAAFAVVVIDIDFFKRINDTFGHEAGDVALIELAKIFKAVSRSADLVSRIGGEEFVIVLHDVDQAAAVRFAERLRTTVKESRIASKAATFTVTVSAGVTLSLIDDQEPGEVLARADKALYAAKGSGRDQVIFYDPTLGD